MSLLGPIFVWLPPQNVGNVTVSSSCRAAVNRLVVETGPYVLVGCVVGKDVVRQSLPEPSLWTRGPLGTADIITADSVAFGGIVDQERIRVRINAPKRIFF